MLNHRYKSNEFGYLGDFGSSWSTNDRSLAKETPDVGRLKENAEMTEPLLKPECIDNEYEDYSSVDVVVDPMM